MTRSSEDVPAGTERQDTQPAGEQAGQGDLSSFDRAINDLQGRIADLRTSVETMGQEGAQTPPPAHEPPAYQPPYEPPPAPEPAPQAYEPQSQGYEPPPQAYEPQAYEAPPQGYEPPPAPAYEPPPPAPSEPPPEVFLDSPAPPAGVPVEGSDALGTFSRVDVGPFEDLLAMTAFEEQLSALPSMTDVRVRRFGGGRAEIELVTAGVVPVAREVMRVAPDARTVLQPDGSLTVELTDPRWTGPPAQPAEADQGTEPEAGETHG